MTTGMRVWVVVTLVTATMFAIVYGVVLAASTSSRKPRKLVETT